MEFGSHTFNNDPEKPENDNGSGKNWKSISKFILNQDLETFRDTLKQINTDFYDDFEDTTLKAYNLNHLREDDFKKLKNFGLDHQNLNLINKLWVGEEEADSYSANPYKRIKNLPDISKPINLNLVLI